MCVTGGSERHDADAQEITVGGKNRPLRDSDLYPVWVMYGSITSVRFLGWGSHYVEYKKENIGAVGGTSITADNLCRANQLA